MRIVVSAGEPSGEVLVGLFARELATQAPECELKRLQDAIPLEPVFGFWEGLRAGARLRRALDRAEEWAVRSDPDLVLLVSFSGFHLPLGQRLRRRGIRVLYLGPPQVWAWGKWRVRQLRGAADRVVSLFQFEQEFLSRFGVKASYVGYPFYDNVAGSLSRRQVTERLGFKHDERYVVYLPGSRATELRHHVPLFVEVQSAVARLATGVKGVAVFAGQRDGPEVEAGRAAENGGLKVLSADRYDVMRHADCACAVSGTVTAELAILGVPMAVCYHLSWPSRILARTLVRTPYFALPNILAGKRLVHEVLNPEPEILARMLASLMWDSDDRRQQLDGLARVAAKLGPAGAMARICGLALEMVPRKPTPKTANRWVPE